MADTEETVEDIEGTEEEEEVMEAGGPGKKLFGPSMIKMLVIIAGALVMIIISGTIAYFVAQKVGKPPATEKTSPEKVQKVKPLNYFDMRDFSINTSDIDEPHFVKLTISLGYEALTVELQTELGARRQELRDIVISVVGSKKFSDLNTQDKRNELKKDLLKRINDVLINGQITGIAFTEFVIT